MIDKQIEQENTKLKEQLKIAVDALRFYLENHEEWCAYNFNLENECDCRETMVALNALRSMKKLENGA